MGASKGVWKVLACAVCGQLLEVQSPADLVEGPDGSPAVICPSCGGPTSVIDDETSP
jgi:hypothetical protein